MIPLITRVTDVLRFFGDHDPTPMYYSQIIGTVVVTSLSLNELGAWDWVLGNFVRIKLKRSVVRVALVFYFQVQTDHRASIVNA